MPDKRSQLSKADRKRLAEYAENRIDELWDDYVSRKGCGIWVRHEDAPSVDTETLLDSGLIEKEERIAALEMGGNPTAAEVKAYQEWWSESQLEGEGDADKIPGYALAAVNDGDGHEGIALLLRTGYSFSRITTWLEGIFESNEEAIAWMRKGGWCS